MIRWRPHDLLKVRNLRPFEGEPPWVRAALERAPFVVVRRAEAAPDQVAVGVRGVARADRFGTWVAIADVVAAFAPEDLAGVLPCEDRRALPVFAALTALCEKPGFGTTLWGPCGSAGFELAAGVPTVTAASDLDLLIRAPDPLRREDAARLLNEIRRLAEREAVRIDAQLETPMGGVALSEFASGKARVMARHVCGPRLIDDPWMRAPAVRDGA